MERIDHIIIKADDLHSAVSDFKNAGFQVYYGTKKEKAYNALVYLQDHCMLELLKTTVIPPFARVLTKWGVFRWASPIFNRFGNFYLKEGPIIDYPVHSARIEDFHARVKNRSSKLKTNAKRKKPNGLTVHWKCFMPKNLDFPFVITDYEPEKMSADETDVHPNGIEGVQTLKVGVADEMDAFREELKNFYGIDEDSLYTMQDGFDVSTANATVEYRKSTLNRVHGMVLYPFDQGVNKKLGKYGITTADIKGLTQSGRGVTTKIMGA